MADLIRAEVSVSGFVQGVFFRAETRRLAASLGLKGWVRNAPDGTVEAVFEGERKSVEKAVDWCWSGPPGARVENVEVGWSDPVGEPGFEVKYL